MADEESFPMLTIVPNGSSGIEIRAHLGEKFNCVEYTLRDNVPQTVFISPWMQFEPAALNDKRLNLAHQIIQRANAYDELIKQLTSEQKRCKAWQESFFKQQDTTTATMNMWRAERVSLGLPEDFSDIKEWPPEML